MKKTGLNSNVVSSHWRYFGEKTSIFFNDDFTSAEIASVGFDDFRKNNLINRIKNIPILIYLYKHYYPVIPKK